MHSSAALTVFCSARSRVRSASCCSQPGNPASMPSTPLPCSSRTPSSVPGLAHCAAPRRSARRRAAAGSRRGRARAHLPSGARAGQQRCARWPAVLQHDVAVARVTRQGQQIHRQGAASRSTSRRPVSGASSSTCTSPPRLQSWPSHADANDLCARHVRCAASQHDLQRRATAAGRRSDRHTAALPTDWAGTLGHGARPWARLANSRLTAAGTPPACATETPPGSVRHAPPTSQSRPRCAHAKPAGPGAPSSSRLPAQPRQECTAVARGPCCAYFQQPRHVGRRTNHQT